MKKLNRLVLTASMLSVLLCVSGCFYKEETGFSNTVNSLCGENKKTYTYTEGAFPWSWSLSVSCSHSK